MIDRDLPIAKEACNEIRESVMQELDIPEDEVSEVHAWGCDVTNTDQVRETINEIGKKFGGVIDIFVGAAGMQLFFVFSFSFSPHTLFICCCPLEGIISDCVRLSIIAMVDIRDL